MRIGYDRGTKNPYPEGTAGRPDSVHDRHRTAAGPTPARDLCARTPIIYEAHHEHSYR
jgi:hypothetical protein